MSPNHNRPTRHTRRAVLGGAALAALTVAAGAGTANATPSAAKATWPTEFPLPNGFLPEGITIGSKPYAYMGSRANGAIYRTDLRTGEGQVLHAGGTGLVSVGLKLDRDGLLYIAGGPGAARTVDSRTGCARFTSPQTPDTTFNGVAVSL